MKHKFKVGDRVRVVKIDDYNYYGNALYKIGDAGIITYCGRTFDKSHKNDYIIKFDRLKAIGKDPEWCALEHWLEPELLVMVFE